ncbi:MAG: hypothetical protein M2R46_02485 [Verrucomicrobia subdivision 3 bacterium]|nr:hypothetical protein [Limisphaerales bacterium]
MINPHPQSEIMFIRLQFMSYIDRSHRMKATNVVFDPFFRNGISRLLTRNKSQSQ